MTITSEEFHAVIKEHGGTISGGINWSWATFDDPEKASQCFDKLKDYCEHRGLYPASADTKAGFRFR